MSDNKGQMGLPGAVAMIVGGIIGTGIFTLPAAIGKFGMASLVGLIIATIGAISLALVFSSLSKRTQAAGGPYAYAREGFGDAIGFFNAFSYWCAAWPGNSAIVLSWVFYVQALFGWTPGQNSTQMIIIAMIGLWVPAAINLMGVKSMAKFQVITSVLKFIPMIFLGTVGIYFAFKFGNWPEWNPSGESTMFAVSNSIAIATFSYVGVECASIAAASVKNPEKNVPIATVIGTLVCAAVYILVTVAVLGIVPYETLTTSGAPFADAFNAIFGVEWAGKVVALFAVISGIGALNGWTMIASAVPQVAAENNLFPPAFKKLNRNGVPYWGILTATGFASLAVIAALSSSGGVEAFSKIVTFSGVTVGVPYFFSVLAQLYWLYTDGRKIVNPVKFVRECVIAIIGLVFTYWMVIGSGELANYLAFIVFLGGFVMMTWMYIRTGRFANASISGDANATADASAGH